MAAVVAAGGAVASAVIAGGALVAQIAQMSLFSSTRTVAIHLSNFSTDILRNPQVYTYKGHACTPPHLTVRKAAQEICTFGNGSGDNETQGVLTYDITEDMTGEAVIRLAIMFSVPDDYSSNKNCFALGFFDPAQPCNRELFSLMYYGTETFIREEATGSEISYKDTSRKYIVRGAMSPMEKAEMKVEFWSQDYIEQFDKY